MQNVRLQRENENQKLLKLNKICFCAQPKVNTCNNGANNTTDQ